MDEMTKRYFIREVARGDEIRDLREQLKQAQEEAQGYWKLAEERLADARRHLWRAERAESECERLREIVRPLITAWTLKVSPVAFVSVCIDVAQKLAAEQDELVERLR
jgi:hypothetical protein